MLVVGVLLSIIILVALVASTVCVYLALKKKYPQRRILNELLIVAVTFCISFGVRLAAIICAETLTTIGDGISAGFYLFYTTIGGFSFEGVEEVASSNALSCLILKCFYYGVVAYAAIIALMLISIGISYEFFSYVQTRALRKKYKTVYIFTDTSEISVTLALDIDKEERSQKKGSYAIVFMGKNLEPFDRSNPRHRTIMNNGFYFLSSRFSLKRRERSFEKAFHLTKSQCKKNDKGTYHNKLFHVFALNDEYALSGAEGKNSDIIFTDIRNTLRDYFPTSQKKGEELFDIPTVVNYYLLTGDIIDYEAYKIKVGEIISKYLEEEGINDEPGKIKEKLSPYFQVGLLNDSKEKARHMIDELRRATIGSEMTETAAENYRDMLSPDENNVFRVAVLGFGATGQESMKELFVESSHLSGDEFNYPSRFIADVFDINADNVSGLFAYRHPLFLCKAYWDSAAVEDDEKLLEWSETVRSAAIDELARGGKKVHIGLKELHRLMGFPIVAFHKVSCFDMNFMKRIDRSIGAIRERNILNYRAFIISLGSDESNLKTANVLLNDFKSELLLKPEALSHKISVFINISDGDNLYRLDWFKEDNSYFKDKICIVPFGMSNQIWNYNYVLNDKKQIMYNHCYKLADEFSRGKEHFSMSDLRDSIKARLQAEVADIGAKDEWLTLDAYARESNRSADEFGINYYIGYRLGYKEEFLTKLEHLRWNRFYMANGWVYADYGGEDKLFRRQNKEHTCLCPYVMLNDDVKIYDKINVLLGILNK